MSEHNNNNMGLKDIGATLPPGFRFYPSDEELVCHYLFKKICNEQVSKGTLVEIDLHTCEPWQLPDVAKLNASEWYFFSFRDRKYATGYRTNRATTSGYWKATGKDRAVMNPATKEVVGMRKTLVFYRNRAPNGFKTCWIMHEFRLETPNMPPKEDWVLCRVFHKSKGASENNYTEIQSPPPHNKINIYTSPPSFPTLTTDHSMPHNNNNNNSNINNNSSYVYPHYDQITPLHISSSSTVRHRDHDHQYNTNNNNNISSSNASNSIHDHDLELSTNDRNTTSAITDEYGLLWDINFEDNGLENDNSMVFL